MNHTYLHGHLQGLFTVLALSSAVMRNGPGGEVSGCKSAPTASDLQLLSARHTSPDDPALQQPSRGRVRGDKGWGCNGAPLHLPLTSPASATSRYTLWCRVELAGGDHVVVGTLWFSYSNLKMLASAKYDAPSSEQYDAACNSSKGNPLVWYLQRQKEGRLREALLSVFQFGCTHASADFI